MSETTSSLGASVPPFLYGTAWKEERSEALTLLAIEQGFRGIDTANQRRHYYEEGVGRGVAKAIERGLVRRDELFLQTKFTFPPSQDHRLPYDPEAPVGRQVEQSIASSLEHLNTSWLDSYVLHGPSQRIGLGEQDWQAWRAMEAAHGAGLVKRLGVSNISLPQLELLCQSAQTRPTFVQNRCYASRGWDRAIRRYCQSQGIIYQGFSLLTANRDLLAHPQLKEIAERYGRAPTQIIFRFALDVGMLPLTGTTDAQHMQADLAVTDFRLRDQEIACIEMLGLTL